MLHIFIPIYSRIFKAKTPPPPGIYRENFLIKYHKGYLLSKLLKKCWTFTCDSQFIPRLKGKHMQVPQGWPKSWASAALPVFLQAIRRFALAAALWRSGPWTGLCASYSAAVMTPATVPQPPAPGTDGQGLSRPIGGCCWGFLYKTHGRDRAMMIPYLFGHGKKNHWRP